MGLQYTLRRNLVNDHKVFYDDGLLGDKIETWKNSVPQLYSEITVE